MMTKKELASIIEAQVNNVNVEVKDIYELDDAVFCTYDWDAKKQPMSGTTAAAVVYNGTCFTCRDWQSNAYPHTPEEIEDYEWRDFANGIDGIIINGLPRAL